MNQDNVILNLKIMTEVKKNDKLTFQDDILAIQRDNIFQAIRRWYTGETRNKSLEYINTIYESAFALADNLIQELENEINRTFIANYKPASSSGKKQSSAENPSELLDRVNKNIYDSNLARAHEQLARGKTYDLLQRLLIEMNCSTKGIVNLKETYHNDIATLSKISLLEDKIRDKIDNINTCFRSTFKN